MEPLAPRAASDLRLGFVTQQSAARDADGIVTMTGVGRLVEALRARVAKVTLGLSLAPTPHAAYDHRLDLDAIQVLPFGHVPTMARGFLMQRELRRAVEAVEDESDVVLVQLPWAPISALTRARRPRVYPVCSDIRTVVWSSTYYRGVHKVAARAAAWMVDEGQRRLMHRGGARVVTNGAPIWEHYGRPAGRPVVSSILRDAEIGSAARRRAPDAPLRLLFVGFVRPDKGVDTLLDAFEQVMVELPEVELRMLGSADLTKAGYASEIGARLERAPLAGRVSQGGQLPFGPAMFAEYADADILVVPSRSEGTPRVLVEARAFGCLTIGTRAGGIPTSITDGVDGVLVPPDDPAALARAILALARDPVRRAAMVAAGIERARRTTVESYAGEILAEALLARS